MAPPIPKTMLAWRETVGKHEPFKKEVPVPKPAPNQVLLKVLAAGVCHSDCTLLALDQKLPGMAMHDEFTLGHEACGEIVDMGSEVDQSKFSYGDRVAMFISPGCERKGCRQCSIGLNRLCRNGESGNYGLGIDDGGFAEYIAIKASAAVKIPKGMDPAVAAVAPDAVLTAYHAVKYTAKVKPGQTIVIYGLGGVGLNGLQTAMHLGAKDIFVVDKRQEVLEEAIKQGVPRDHAFCTGDPNAKRIEQHVAEKGIVVDTTLDFVGHTDTVMSAQFTVKPEGTIVVVGLFSQTWTVLPMVVVMQEINVKGSYNGTVEGLGECLELIEQGVIKPVVETGSIEDLPKMLKDLDEGKIKSRMVLLPDWKK